MIPGRGFLCSFLLRLQPIGFPPSPDSVLGRVAWPVDPLRGAAGWDGGAAGIGMREAAGGFAPRHPRQLQPKGAGWKCGCFPGSGVRTLSALQNGSVLAFPGRLRNQFVGGAEEMAAGHRRVVGISPFLVSHGREGGSGVS